MNKTRSKICKTIAGCMAAIMTIASGGLKPDTKAEALQFPFKYESVSINATTFPDPNFRAVVSSDFDRDKNGILDSDEIILARNVWCIGKGIKSMKGIEYLKEMRGIYCMDNEIETWDLSQNQQITGIWCSGNKFKSLDFSVIPTLEWVYCYDCQLTSLNVSKNPKMAFIECNTNPLKELDVSHNPVLEHLMCGSCEITELDLSHNPNLQHLDAFRNKLTTLDVTCCPKMKRLDVWDNRGLGSIDVSKCPGLQYYNCAHNDATSVDVSHNPELTKLICSYNYLESLDVSNNPKLAYLDCLQNQLKSLDISHNPNLHFLQAFINDFTELDIGYNPFLIKTHNEGKDEDIWGYGKFHSWKIDFGGRTSTGGDNVFFIAYDNKVKLEKTQKQPFPSEYPDDETITDTSQLITREAAVQTLYEMAGKPSVSGLKSRFTDVEKGSWYEDALLWGEKNALCLGYPYVIADTFGVGKWVTREDVALMLMRYSEFMNYEREIDFGRSDDFIDYFDVDFDHWEAICWACTWHIIDGKGEEGAPKSERIIDPHGKATREEFTEMINTMLEVNKKTAEFHIPENPQTTTTTSSTSTTTTTVTTVTATTTTRPVKPEITEDYSLGDVNNDKSINAIDASAILTYYAKTSTKEDGGFSDKQEKSADVNNDGLINAVDASGILAYYAYVSTATAKIMTMADFMKQEA
ncbi:dockerin type I domain-containing protein [Ruminococcus flavefaciens]|uniref:dockerin type I domain-containing protein n=1 Tax=Ruminococcus flavefaciens TaxID=1265 RepID=UPI00046561E1|nr:dockerin type I domain-containing protein [Ruminococcus flavefaciens]